MKEKRRDRERKGEKSDVTTVALNFLMISHFPLPIVMHFSFHICQTALATILHSLLKLATFLVFFVILSELSTKSQKRLFGWAARNRLSLSLPLSFSSSSYLLSFSIQT